MIYYSIAAAGEKYLKQADDFAIPALKKIGVTGEGQVQMTCDPGSLHRNYNLALAWARAKPDLEALVLVHPDLAILDPDFEKKVRAALAEPDVAVVGVIGAGGVWSARWWEGNPLKGHIFHEPNGPMAELRHPVATGDVDVVDGCVLALSPQMVRDFTADTATFRDPAWHSCSDDLCLTARRKMGKRVVVIDSDCRHHTVVGQYSGGEKRWNELDDALQIKHHMGKYGRVAAVISVCGHPELLDLQLQSHRIFTRNIAPEDFIVVDAATHGGVQKRTAGVCKKHKATYLQSPGTPQGVTSNVGIEFATKRVGAEWLVLANDDLVVGPGWWDTMFTEWDYLSRQMQRPGIIGASSNYVSGKQSRCTALRGNVPVLSTKIVISFFALTRADIMAQVGGYAPVHNSSDTGMAYKLTKSGFNAFVSRQFIQHFGSQSLGPQTPDAYRADIQKGNAYMDATHPDWREVLSE